MGSVTIYTTAWCGYCQAAKELLDQHEVAYEEISVDDDPGFRQRLLDLTGRWTVPQILVDDEPIGGYVELARLIQLGDLPATTSSD
jgi:glutaredoxin 3